MLGRIRVAGHSMEPALHHGDELLVARIPPRIGSVVVCRDPRDRDRLVVKRVAALDGDGLTLASDNAGHEGLHVDRRDVVGRAILRYRPRLSFKLGAIRSARPDPSRRPTHP